MCKQKPLKKIIDFVCYFEHSKCDSNVILFSTLLETFIVNNFLTKNVQTENGIFSKYTNENLSIMTFSNLLEVEGLV